MAQTHSQAGRSELRSENRTEIVIHCSCGKRFKGVDTRSNHYAQAKLKAEKAFRKHKMEAE